MELLKLLQEDIPLVEEPFSWIGEKLSISEEEVINRIKELKEKKNNQTALPYIRHQKGGIRQLPRSL